MANASLDGIRAKLNRAKKHATDFDMCEVELMKRDPYAITVDLDAKPPHTLHFAWKVKEKPPIDLALIFGDFLSNLRSALDYLVWQLVLVNNGTPTQDHAFPCVKNRANWASAVGGRLRDVDPKWIGEIEKLQPYHRTPDPERHLLAVLDAINNTNKHRTLPPILTVLPCWEFKFDLEANTDTMNVENFLADPLEDGKDFLRLTFDPPRPKLELGLQKNPPVHVAFRDGLDYSDGWTWTQADLIEWVETAVAIFEPAFPS